MRLGWAISRLARGRTRKTSSPEGRFWDFCDRLVSSTHINIDRPKGTRHPRWAFLHPLDYGFLEGTKGGDGVGVDVWRGTQSERVTGAIFTVDTLKSEGEVKLLIGCSPEEAAAGVEIHNKGSQTGLLVLRP